MSIKTEVSETIRSFCYERSELLFFKNPEVNEVIRSFCYERSEFYLSNFLKIVIWSVRGSS